jgi:HlyD family secretion protein
VKKKTVWFLVILIVVLAAGGLAYRALASSRASEESAVQTATVQQGELSTSLSSSGNVRAGQSATVKWQTSGKVSDISLKAGDLVQEDQELAALDLSSLSTEMINARQDLIEAQEALDDLLNSKMQQAQALQALEDAQLELDNLKQSGAEDFSQAQLALANAQDELADAIRNRTKMDYPHTSDKLIVEKAQTDYLLAKQAYKEAMSEYNKWIKKNLTNKERVRALNTLVSAKQLMESKLGIYNWYILPYTDSEIAQADAELAVAQANLDSARSTYDNLKNGVSEAAVALAEARLEDAQRAWERLKDGASEEDIASAQAAVDAAQASLDHATLLAPFTGTITEVDVTSGDLVSLGDTAFRIDDLASLYIDLMVSEVDLASLEVGQPAILEFDAIPDKVYTGEVIEIGMVGTNSQGVVNYPVTVKVMNADEAIRSGMTATVTITTDQRQDVLMVPNRAIRNSGGQQTVTVLFEGQQIPVTVTVGLVGDSMSEVTSSQLREGDTVVINGTTASTTSSNSDRPQFMEMGGPPGDGGMMIISP